MRFPALLFALLLTGCSSVKVPTTKIKLGNQTAEFPKQFRADSLVLDVETNGRIHFAATNIVAENEPNVIQATGEAQAKVEAVRWSGIANVTTSTVATAVSAAMKGAK